MPDRALEWVAQTLGVSIVDYEFLTGGNTSTIVHLIDADAGQFVLRLITSEPWRSVGAELVRREQIALRSVANTGVRGPQSIAVDPMGACAGHPAHVMTHVPGTHLEEVSADELQSMARSAALIHSLPRPWGLPQFESWAPPRPWAPPPWSIAPRAWQALFTRLDAPAPPFEPTFLHRDFSHRNLLWQGTTVSGVVDWVEASIGPPGLDIAHGATNLAVSFGVPCAIGLLEAYEEEGGGPVEPYWLAFDVTGFLPGPSGSPPFESEEELFRLDSWVQHIASLDLSTMTP